MASLDVGAHIGPYEIAGLIAHGGMGSVYRARLSQRPDAPLAALKVIRIDHAANDDALLRFRREADAMRQLEHPNIVRTLDVGEDAESGQHYIAMELIAGGTLQHILRPIGAPPGKREPMTIGNALRIVRDIGAALSYAHKKGLVHRDVKPSNIFLRPDGGAVLGDFGVVLVSAATKITGTLNTIGTPDYMSPEQCKGQPLDGRSDVYSLGIVLFEMLAGRAPYSADSPIAVVYQQIGEPLPDIGAARPDTPAPLRALLARMTAKDAGKRYQSADDLLTAIDAINAPETPGAVSSGDVKPKLPSLRILAPIAGGLAVLILGLLFIARPASVAPIAPAAATAVTAASATPAPGASPTAAVQTGDVYDAFDDAQFDNTINARLWEPRGMGNVLQSQGILRMEKGELRTAGGPRAEIRGLDRTRGFRVARARMRALPEQASEDGFVGWIVYAQLPGGLASFTCGVEQIDGGATVRFVASALERGLNNPETAEGAVKIGEWHQVSITHDPAAQTLTCLIDGGRYQRTYPITQSDFAVRLNDGRFGLALSAASEMRSTGVYEIDDVEVAQAR
jgi:hypothetical protein